MPQIGIRDYGPTDERCLRVGIEFVPQPRSGIEPRVPEFCTCNREIILIPRPLGSQNKMPDLVIEAYKVDVDRTLLRENLKLTPQQRFDKFSGVMRNLMSLRAAGQRARQQRVRQQRTTELPANDSPSLGSSSQ